MISEPSAVQARNSFDTGSLSWVADEIRESLSRSRAVLTDALAQDGDAQKTALRQAKVHLHQAHGALEVVGLDGVTLLTHASEALLDRLLAQEGATFGRKEVDAIFGAYHALVEYLDELLAGSPHQPVRLYPYYQGLREAAGITKVHPSELFLPDLSVRVRLPLAAPDTAGNYTWLRQRFEKALLPYLKSTDPETDIAAAVVMSELISEAERVQTTQAGRALWWALGAFAEVASSGEIRNELFVKQVFGRINLLIRRIADGGAVPDDQLLRDALFFVAGSSSASPRVRQVQSAWQLDGMVPADYQQKRYGQIDTAAIALAKERLHQAKTLWNRIAGGDGQAIDSFSKEMAGLVDAVSRMNVPAFTELLREMDGVAGKAARSDPASSAGAAGPLGVEIAASLLFVENALQHTSRLAGSFAERAQALAQRLRALAGGRRPDAAVQWLDDMSRQAQQKETMAALAGEMQSSLAQVEKLLDEYFNAPSHRNGLPVIDTVLHQIEGALQVLDQDDAVQAVQHTRRAVQNFAAADTEPPAAAFQQVARNVGALSFFIEALQLPSATANKGFVFDAAQGVFRAGLLQDAARNAVEVDVDPGPETTGIQVPVAPSVAANVVRAPQTPADSSTDSSTDATAEFAAKPAGAEAPRPSLEEADRLIASLPELPPLSADTSIALDTALGQASQETAPAAPAPTVVPPGSPDAGLPLSLPSLVDEVMEPDAALSFGEALSSSSAPLVAAASPAPVPAAVSAAQDEAVDAELLEIFLEEATEVLGCVRETVPQLVAQPNDQEFITTLRRSFHTLKGSGRMVGLMAFGEGAWSVEQVLNVRIADGRGGSPDLVALIEKAVDVLGRWVNDLQTQGRSDCTQHALVQAADRVRQGGDFTWDVATVSSAPETSMPTAPSTTVDAPIAGATDAPTDALPVPSIDAEDATPPLAPDVPDGALHAERSTDLATDFSSAPPLDLSFPSLDFATAAPDADPVPTPTVVPDSPQAADPVLESLELSLPDVELPDDAGFADMSVTENLPAAIPELDWEAASQTGEAASGISLDSHDSGPSAAGARPAGEAPSDAFEFSLDMADAGGGPLSADSVSHGLAALDDVLADAGADVAQVPSEAFDMSLSAAQDMTRLGQHAQEEHEAHEGHDAQEAHEAHEAHEAQETHEAQDEPVAAASTSEDAEGVPSSAQVIDFRHGSAPHVPRDDSIRRIGHLEISVPLHNIFLSETDELVRLLAQDFSEWRHEPERDVNVFAVHAAHSLSGASATVGFEALHDIAHALELALQRQVKKPARVQNDEYDLLDRTVVVMREMLQSFALGELPYPEPALVSALRNLLAVFTERGGADDPPESSMLMQDEAQMREYDVPPRADVAPRDVSVSPAREGVPVAPPSALVNDELDPDLLPVFVEEGTDLLPQLGGLLRAWQKAPSDSAPVPAMLRLLHTLKGSARMAGAMVLGQHMHDMESRIEQIGIRGEARAETVDELLGRLDYALYLFEQLQPAGTEAAAPLAGVARRIPESGSLVSPPAVDGQPMRRASDNLVAANPAALASAAASLPRPQNADSDVPVVSPVAGQTPMVRVRADMLDRLVNQAGEVSISRSRVETEVETLRQSLGELTENVSRLRGQLREIEIQAESQMASQMAQAGVRDFDPLEFDRFTRLQELTRMMAESVNDVATVQQNIARSVDDATLDLGAQARLTRDLQQDLMRVRMVQFSSVAERLYRVTRQAAKELDKRVNLDIRGGSVEMDRSVLEKMAGPFEHLLRNAIVHGIESREARVGAGKNETGELLVEVRQEGNEVQIRFSDDGRGLDLARIREKARDSGLLAPGAELPDAEARELIFHPGFSTAQQVTELAGRGVGMDVVRSEALALGGRVQTFSEPGKGTTFVIQLPLTLAVTQVVLLAVGGRSFAVPSVLVEQVQQLRTQALASAYNDGAVQWLGQRVPLHYLAVLLGDSQTTPMTQQYSPVVIMKSGTERVALHVDEVIGNREVVVKNVGPQLARMAGIAGATVLGSGDIVLILDPVPLAQQMQSAMARAPHRFAQEGVHPLKDAGAVAEITDVIVDGNIGQTQPVQGLRAQHIVMVVDDSLTVRRVTQRLLTREGYQVVLAKDGVDALEQLQSITPDVMLVDIEMPRMDGFDLTRNVRGDSRTRPIPIIMITSRTASKHRNYALELGVNEYLGKPFQDTELLRLLVHYTGREALA